MGAVGRARILVQGQWYSSRWPHRGGLSVLKNILILGLAIAMRTLLAQVPAAEAFEEPFKLSATAELVLLDVSAKDAAGEHVANLGKGNFRVYEDGKLQKIAEFARDDVPVTVGLVIDTSRSMRPKYRDVVTAALAFIQASNRNDEIFIVNFGDRVNKGLPEGIPFTADLVRLRMALSWAVPAGRTALYDAIVFSLQHLEKGTCAKKTLMLVSDGGDNSSIHGSDEVMRMVRESRATIYTIGILDPEDRDKNPALLRRLAKVSGGESFFPELLSEVVGICRQIASDVRARYTIGYVPVRSGELGSLRKVKVTASSPAGRTLVVHSRTSYVLPPKRPVGEREGEPGGRRSR
ncbi:MAG: VWA domain-containing protein [Acidobacteria bacterium]|nr:VWA domain-containing protein [Acidobacteriota bacterium]